jgi:AraC family transcriptional regulator of adaptative response/methylated-DNA-[protein]-cysteine methyltransferase
MISEELKKEYYRALIDKNSEYEGIFYVGVKTTGVFCRPTCPARKPKAENCEFFTSLKQTLLASYRPCKRCRPLLHPNSPSEIINKLVEAIEENPEKRWKDIDFKELGVDTSTVRRQFKKRFGMTFVEYARSRRIGLAMQQIRAGELVIEAQLSSGFESSSGFRDAFSRIMGAPPTLVKNDNVLRVSWLDTMLGPMVAISDDNALYLLEFVDRRGLELEVERLRLKTKLPIIPGITEIITSIKYELELYFKGKLREFKTPIALLGSNFQKNVWNELKKIPFGRTTSYAALASSINMPSACRAVANANGTNQLSIIIPCHRVINANGELGGYGGGIVRKKWLINHEQQAM